MCTRLAASAPFGALFVDRTGLDFGASGQPARFIRRAPNPPANAAIRPIGDRGSPPRPLLDGLRGARRARKPIAFRVVAPRQAGRQPRDGGGGGELFGGDGEPARARSWSTCRR